jgi:hypothetical protein
MLGIGEDLLEGTHLTLIGVSKPYTWIFDLTGIAVIFETSKSSFEMIVMFTRQETAGSEE